jgi:hypothetical protein
MESSDCLSAIEHLVGPFTLGDSLGDGPLLELSSRDKIAALHKESAIHAAPISCANSRALLPYFRNGLPFKKLGSIGSTWFLGFPVLGSAREARVERPDRDYHVSWSTSLFMLHSSNSPPYMSRWS